MMFARGETVARLRRVLIGTDGYGNDLYDDVPTEKSLECVGVVPRYSSERDQGESTVIVGKTLLVPPLPGYDALPTDRFRVAGVVYEVDGEVGVWRSPFSGTFFGTEVPVKRVY
jgi:hypothetical protein